MSPKQIVDPREWNIPMGLVIVIIAAAVAVTGFVASIKADISSIRHTIEAELVPVRKFAEWKARTEKINPTWNAAEYPE